MAPPVVKEDYYVVLGVSRTADADDLKSAWRRLARTRHPDKNPGNPNATAEFQLLESAYSTLSDPTRRRAYDLQHPTTGTSYSTYTSASSRADNDATEQKVREKESQRNNLYHEARRKEQDVFEAKRNLNRIRREIEKLDEDAKKDVPEESGWWGYFSSMLSGAQQQQREKKSRERERRCLDRIATKRIKERDLNRQTDKVALLERVLRATQDEINKITLEIQRHREQQAAARRREAQRQQEEQAAARRREAQRQQEEQEAAWRREAQRQQEEFARREKARREREEAEAARRASELEERERLRRERDEETARIFERLRRVREEREAESCAHRAWWKKIEGPHLCSHCSTRTTKFALQCPQCQKITCASCRKVVQKGGRKGKNTKRAFDTGYHWDD
ncbi:hypothetical protein F5Y05DRAFT_23675 [Hypoxylon sp. FL0543]|nr:hypothetical protein F5Y05DRAFT_23675 [Hypoxylon sp. FL0543]